MKSKSSVSLTSLGIVFDFCSEKVRKFHQSFDYAFKVSFVTTRKLPGEFISTSDSSLQQHIFRFYYSVLTYNVREIVNNVWRRRVAAVRSFDFRTCAVNVNVNSTRWFFLVFRGSWRKVRESWRRLSW